MKNSILRFGIIALSICIICTQSVAALEYGIEINPEQTSYSQRFYDVPESHWAFKFISELVDREAISGYPDGNYYPNNKVTRAEFARIMMVAAGANPMPVARSSYSDVPTTHWSSPFVEAAKNFMTGYQVSGKLYFKPSTPAVREDIAVAVVKLKGYDSKYADLSMLKIMFKDYYSISSAALPYVALAVENGLISGFPNGTFAAQASITRAETASILWRAFQYGNENKVVDTVVTPVETPIITPIVVPEETDAIAATIKPPTTTVTQTTQTDNTTIDQIKNQTATVPKVTGTAVPKIILGDFTKRVYGNTIDVYGTAIDPNDDGIVSVQVTGVAPKDLLVVGMGTPTVEWAGTVKIFSGSTVIGIVVKNKAGKETREYITVWNTMD